MGPGPPIILDTHLWIWGNSDPSRLPQAHLQLLEEKKRELAISAISVWEVVTAAQKGRIKTTISPEQTVRGWLRANEIRVIPLDEEIALLARTLEFQHSDPADRFIAATAFRHGLSLVTVDSNLRGLPWHSVLPTRN